jgi:hypothetical protein
MALGDESSAPISGRKMDGRMLYSGHSVGLVRAQTEKSMKGSTVKEALVERS